MDRPIVPPQPLVWINGWPAVGKQTVAQCLAQILGHDRAVLIDDHAFTDQLDLPQGVPRPGCTRARGSSVSVGGLGPGPLPKPMPVPVSEPADDASPPDTLAALDACFRTYVEDPAALHRLILFTDCCADDAPGALAASRYADAARRAGRPFVPVYVECGVSENERRTQTSERRCSGEHGRTDDEEHQQAPPIGVLDSPSGNPDSSDDVRGSDAGSPSTAMATRTICTLAEARELRARTGGRLFTFPRDTWPGLFVDVTTQGVHETAMEILAFINAVVEQRGSAVAAAAAAAAARRPMPSV